MRDALSSWTALLAEGDTAAIVGVFPDWTTVQKEGSVAGANDALVAPIIDKLIKLGRVTSFFSFQTWRRSRVLHMTGTAWDDSRRRESDGNSAARRCVRQLESVF